MRWGVGDAMVWEGDAPRCAPLDTGFRRYDDGGCAGRRGLLVAGGPLRVPSGQASTASGRTGREARVRWGRGDAMGDLWRPPPRGSDTGGRPWSTGPALAGRAIRVARLRWGVGVGDARGVGGGGAPPGAPLDTGFRRYDDGGVRVSRCCWCGAGGPALAGRAIREAPLRRGGGAHEGGVPACAGVTRAVGRRGCDGAFPTWDGDAPRRAPLDTGFRRYDGGGVRGRRALLVSGGPFDRLRANGFGKRACGGEEGMRWWGTETPRAAPRPWVPAFARTTIGVWGLASVAGVGRGSGRRQGHADYKRGTKDGAALRTGPPRMNCLVGLGPFGGLWAFGCALFSSGSGPACRGHRVLGRGSSIAWVSAP